MKAKIRLQKYIASCTNYSRRKAEELIKDGHVKLNGKSIKIQGITLDPSEDIVELNNKKLTPQKETVYILLNKPTGYISTKSDNHNRKTVMDLIPNKNVYPIGRLDKDTKGLLLFTNDGNFAHEVTHPKFEHEKEYIVHLKNIITANDKKKLEKGVIIDGAKTSPCSLFNIENKESFTKCHIIIHEGKKRQIKRMFGIIGNRVIYLKRIRIGNLTLPGIKEGTYKIITKSIAQKALKK
ncbi:rRNA pseudouridine synthase [bacterium]|nr:rRNA pseudouridine synthase [bacterium]